MSASKPVSTFSPRSMLLPLALAQFIASYACTNMNVAVSAIAEDLGTTVIGVQTAITLFTLTMAALMIPGSKLSDIFGRRRCFRAGLAVYGVGALIDAGEPDAAEEMLRAYGHHDAPEATWDRGQFLLTRGRLRLAQGQHAAALTASPSDSSMISMPRSRSSFETTNGTRMRSTFP